MLNTHITLSAYLTQFWLLSDWLIYLSMSILFTNFCNLPPPSLPLPEADWNNRHPENYVSGRQCWSTWSWCISGGVIDLSGLWGNSDLMMTSDFSHWFIAINYVPILLKILFCNFSASMNMGKEKFCRLHSQMCWWKRMYTAQHLHPWTMQ
jgi:hypothetical protein